MEMALARIELLYGMKPNATHWEMFKNDCMEKEKKQIVDACNSILEDASSWGEKYYNQVYKENK